MTPSVTRVERSTGSFAHPALFHRGSADYAAGVGGFVRAALAAPEPVLVAVPGERPDLLRGVLGPASGEVESADMTALGRNPGRILARLREFAAGHRGRPVRIVGEPIRPGRSAAEITGATRHEALINLAFRGMPATVLCPYDTTGLPPAVLVDARRTHPTLLQGGTSRPGPACTDPALMVAACDTPLPEPPGARELVYGPGRLAQVRDHVHGWAAAAGLARTADLVLAVGEATANSLAHGGGLGRLRLWTADGHAVAEITDGGRPVDSLAGRARPGAAEADGGRGLWMIHQPCDLVETRVGGAGLTLRLHVRMFPGIL
ncbi:sensor histidine kinase [Kitasatospora sp. NBC_00240]|uniref:anti-sigma factor RsbA family regulatory protein n=1 Tax=Kitasatospora sp. NBC_00240 TaxID=2903567 RepID=UPI00224F452E|nr:anti-sigma factor RsbA family regulatory protein [Kitasatospora sp. NBC_00240]MCX5207972.1 sensor histidine kinase [Kitasatospora sp. NBC_00240]